MKQKKTNYIYVLDKNGKPLMPTSRAGKVRHMLKRKEAVVVCRDPFTIRLKYKTPGKTQPIHVGIDSGRENIGIAASKEDGECVFLANIKTKNKAVTKQMKDRAQCRNERRGNKREVKQRHARADGNEMKNADGMDVQHHGTVEVPYRDVKNPGAEETVRHKVIKGKEARFNNRRREDGWLTPSARQLVQMHERSLKIVERYLPVSSVTIERVSFDFQKLENTDIKNWQYSKGPLYGFKSADDYIDAEQHGKCLICGVKKITHHHHVLHRSEGGSDKIKNIVGLCDECHDKVHKDVDLNARLVKMKADAIKPQKVALLNSAMPAVIEALDKHCSEKGEKFSITTGYETAQTRRAFDIPKDHCLDAYAISLADRIDNIRTCELCSTVWTFRRFKKKSNNLINSRGSRTYWYKGKCVAVNRHKAIEQNAKDADTGKKKNVDSLEEYMAKYAEKHDEKQCARHFHELEIRPARRVYTAQKHGIRNSYHPGDVVMYEKTNKTPVTVNDYDKKGHIIGSHKECKSYKIAFVVGSVDMSSGKLYYTDIRTGKSKAPNMKFCRFLEGGCLHPVKIEKTDDHIASL